MKAICIKDNQPFKKGQTVTVKRYLEYVGGDPYYLVNRSIKYSLICFENFFTFGDLEQEVHDIDAEDDSGFITCDGEGEKI